MTPALLESTLEERTIRRIARLDERIIVRKFAPPGSRGWPDRIILMPHQVTVFVEFKRPGEEERPLQVYQRGRLEAIGYTCVVVDDENDADILLGLIGKILLRGESL